MSAEKSWKLISMANKILEICVLISAVLVIPLVVVLLAPIFVLRFVVSHLSVFRPDLHEIIINPLDNAFAIDYINSNPLATTLTTTVYKGDITIDTFRNHVMEKVIDVRNGDGEVKNVKLLQYPYKWMGYMFWRWEDNFDISQHVYYYEAPEDNNNSKVSQQLLKELESDLMTKPFTTKTSPWEILVVRNVETGSAEVHSVVLLRIHHCIGDGLSIIKSFLMPLLIMSKDNEKRLEGFIATPSNSLKRTTFQKWLKNFEILISLPFQTAKYLIEIQDNNFWKNPGKKLGNKYFYSLSEKISMDLLKEIKEIHNVGITTLIFAAITAGIRKAMMKQTKQVPQYIHCMLPVPMPDHPDTPTNHFLTVGLRLPVGESDPRTRLRLIQENLDSHKGSLIPFVPFYLGYLAALFPIFCRDILKTLIPTAVGSSFPGPKQTYSLLGHEAVDAYFSVGSCLHHVPVIMTTLSYADGVRMKISVNESVLDNQFDVDDIQRTIEKEFHLLKNTGLKNKHQ